MPQSQDLNVASNDNSNIAVKIVKKKPSSVSIVQNSSNIDSKLGQLLDMVSELKKYTK